ncbi:hypothetical protein PLEOSDRAFT_1084749 [Pleurotus ostreatus PC15]|uniref:Uncharacterized protein n=1 Tax=Pleurotus ostreatus (strain PC15) TaxID=1137138 RepID=A0A067NSN0_PLEO1|nr:hypothetical protein PLEOSDRAFT_1084749 [Pleurotus ostreatus PC15]
MSNSLQHVPAHTTDDLRTMKKKEAVVAYETEVQYFAGMGDAMPELDDTHREDVELAVIEMEQQQDWLSAAEKILVGRELQGSVEDEVRTTMATATGQLLEAQGRLAEWQAEDDRLAQEAREAADAERRRAEDEERREAEATEERRSEEARRAAEVRDARRRDAFAAEARRQAARKAKLVAGSGAIGRGSGSAAPEPVGGGEADDVIEITSDADDDSTPVPRTRGRRARAIRAGKRKAVESDAGEVETTPRSKRLRKRADYTEDAKLKSPPPAAPLDVAEYGEYNPADASASPNNVEWGCGYGALRESCPHPLVEFSEERRCLRCQQGHFTCIGTGCHACETCTGSKVKCSHAKTRARQAKTSEVEASGSKAVSGKGKQRAAPRPRTRRRGGESRETSRVTRAASGNATIPTLVEACADHELRTLVQVMSTMDARIAALKQATEEAESTRAAATRGLAALILRRELEEAQRAEAGDEEEREADREMEEDEEYDGQ